MLLKHSIMCRTPSTTENFHFKMSNAQVKSSFTPSSHLPDFPPTPSTFLFSFIQLASLKKKK